MACEGGPTKSRYLNFDPCGLSTINWIPAGGQISESCRFIRGKISSVPRKKTTGSSAITIPEKSCKRFFNRSKLGDSHTTRGYKNSKEPDSSFVNLDKSSSMPIVNVLGQVETSSSSLHLPSEEGINQVVAIDRVSNSTSWKYNTEFMLYMKRYL